MDNKPLLNEIGLNDPSDQACCLKTAWDQATQCLFTSLVTLLGESAPFEKFTIEGETFYVVKELATGGFSTVCLVQAHSSGLRYAVKRILCQTEEQVGAVRLLHEFHHGATSMLM